VARGVGDSLAAFKACWSCGLGSLLALLPLFFRHLRSTRPAYPRRADRLHLDFAVCTPKRYFCGLQNFATREFALSNLEIESIRPQYGEQLWGMSTVALGGSHFLTRLQMGLVLPLFSLCRSQVLISKEQTNPVQEILHAIERVATILLRVDFTHAPFSFLRCRSPWDQQKIVLTTFNLLPPRDLLVFSLPFFSFFCGVLLRASCAITLLFYERTTLTTPDMHDKKDKSLGSTTKVFSWLPPVEQIFRSDICACLAASLASPDLVSRQRFHAAPSSRPQIICQCQCQCHVISV